MSHTPAQRRVLERLAAGDVLRAFPMSFAADEPGQWSFPGREPEYVEPEVIVPLIVAGLVHQQKYEHVPVWKVTITDAGRAARDVRGAEPRGVWRVAVGKVAGSACAPPRRLPCHTGSGHGGVRGRAGAVRRVG